MPLVIRLTVVSCPAMSSSTAVDISSRRLNPPSGPGSLTNAESMSQEGLPRRLSARSPRYRPIAIRAAMAARWRLRRVAAGGGVDAPNDRLRPCAEPRFVLARHAQQPANDCDRKRIGEVVDQVDAVATLQRVDQLLGDRGDFTVHGVDPAR